VLRSVVLDDFRILAVTGSDRAAFLQGQLTQDVTTLRTDATAMTGWADAKGRLLFAGHAFAAQLGTEEALALLVPAELADALLRRLRLYILRAKAQAALVDTSLLGLLGATEITGESRAIRLYGQDSRYLVLGSAAGAVNAETVPGPSSDWQLAEIRAGLPTIVTATSGEFVPQMVNLDLVGGISFTKGCYTGQEIVARMKYLGRVKRRMLRFSTPGAAPVAGAPVHAIRGPVGQVVASAPTSSGSEFLAVIVVDDLPGPFFLDEGRALPARQLELPYDIPL